MIMIMMMLMMIMMILMMIFHYENIDHDDCDDADVCNQMRPLGRHFRLRKTISAKTLSLHCCLKCLVFVDPRVQLPLDYCHGQRQNLGDQHEMLL